MKAFIVAGGWIDDAFILDYIKKEEYDTAFAVDRGLAFFKRNGLTPDYVVGDFDSVEEPVLHAFERLGPDAAPKIVRLNPMKDDTDTELSLIHIFWRNC